MLSTQSDADFHAQAAVVEAITLLTKNLPSNIPKGKREGKLYQVLTNNNYCGETPWETFNKCMDAMFGEDCWNIEGHLENVCWGWFGMDIVTKYLCLAIDLPGAKAFHIPMMLKLEHLKNKLKILVWVTFNHWAKLEVGLPICFHQQLDKECAPDQCQARQYN